ncbi:class I SAM-dependent methyltransferase [Mucilaginibacter aquariorum]|uniref:Class I SAM-dependent methyltransferase n=1 Tax=Mucilaginibacter aquariorum TaxID=2967225 RepID=A0ABT1T4B0_9SPHI|nr:class I SAM-dependent methyltransferase [Mucilaginibacter aquariorum]MCQ6959106.1 class I SAM-dependent methyltransferase [Mucilaginibacter aquariorum]
MNNQTDHFYNKFSFLYPLVDVFLKPQKKVLFDEINRLPEGNLLEIGVGNGAHFHLYKKHKVVGIDTSAAMLEIARKKCCENIKVFKMDGKALLFYDEEFDYVVLSHVIAVVDDPEQLLKEVLRVLKPQGQVFILNHFTPNNWLRHFDRAFGMISKFFHFKSVFCIDEITTIKKFILLKEVHFGLASYFKLLIYQKK